MSYENARSMLAEARKNPKMGDKALLRDIVYALAHDIRRTMNKGYTLADIVKILHDSESVDIKVRTLATYLRRCKKKNTETKEKKHATVRSAKDATTTKEAQVAEKKPQPAATPAGQAMENKKPQATARPKKDGQKERKAGTKPKKPAKTPAAQATEKKLQAAATPAVQAQDNAQPDSTAEQTKKNGAIDILED